jgi:hypothetical protein
VGTVLERWSAANKTCQKAGRSKDRRVPLFSRFLSYLPFFFASFFPDFFIAILRNALVHMHVVHNAFLLYEHPPPQSSEKRSASATL